MPINQGFGSGGATDERPASAAQNRRTMLTPKTSQITAGTAHPVRPKRR